MSKARGSNSEAPIDDSKASDEGWVKLDIHEGWVKLELKVLHKRSEIPSLMRATHVCVN